MPGMAQAVDTSHPDRWVGTGTPRSCTSRAVVRAVAKGGVIRFRCGPDPVRIEMRRTAKVVNTSRRVVLDGRGLVTLSGGGKRRVLYQNTCDRRQTWTTSHCDDQATPRLVVQDMAFAAGNAPGRRTTVAGAAPSSRAVAGSRSCARRLSATVATGRDRTSAAAPCGRSRSITGSRDRRSQHLPLRGVQQRRRTEQHRRLVVDLQQRLHRQSRHRPRRQPLAPEHPRRRLGRRRVCRRQRLPHTDRRYEDGTQ